MEKSSLSKIYVDHYLQAAILSELAQAERPLRFSELKEDGIENSLFMYHANKLIIRGAIKKTDDGFALTANGARWINLMDPTMFYSKPTPRPLIQFVIQNDAAVLLSTRAGQLKGLLNDYMLPGGLHKSGLSADANAGRIWAQMFPNTHLEPEFISIIEDINEYPDGFTYHSIAHIYHAELPDQIMPPTDERFAFEWVALADITADHTTFANHKSLVTFFEKLLANQIGAREVITSKHD